MKIHVLERVDPWFGEVALDEVDRLLVRQYQQERKEEGVRARTVNLGWNTVRHLLNHAYSLGVTTHSAPQVAPIPERDSKPSCSLSEEEAVYALEYAFGRGSMWHTLVLFLLHTGARWGETRQLRWADLDLSNQIVHLRAETAKQGRARDIPLVSEVVEALEGLPQGHDLVFVRRHQHTGELIPLHEAPRCLGGKYPWEGPEGELHIGPHTFRHTFATWRLRAGVSIAIVSRWLGQSTIQMTVDTYGHIEPAECVEEIGRGPRPQVP